MSEMPDETTADAAFEILGVSSDADEHQIRASYLKLVKQYPPERDPDKFRQIQAAFQAARDPLQQAKSLLMPSDLDEIPNWQDVIDSQAKKPPKMQATFVLSLGNRSNSPRIDSATEQDEADADE